MEMNYEQVKSLFLYNPKTGVLTNKIDRNYRAKAGTEAGGIDSSNGYRYVKVGGKSFKVSRISWLMHYGEWPKNQIDHINGVRDDNRIENLRDVTNQENHKNRKMPKNNLSGVIGVHWYKPRGKWCAYIRANGRRRHLGYFTDLKIASNHRLIAECIHGYHDNHGRV
jgi:hypothetical protein